MINHFVNLVGWETIYEEPSDQERFFADTLTMKLAARVFAARTVPVVPGSSMAGLLYDGKPVWILHSGKGAVPDGAKHNFIQAPPMISNVREYAAEISERLPDDATLFTGLSSPKQNLLAREILNLKPDVEIFCIGAIVDDYMFGRSVPEAVRRLRVEWLFRAFVSPRRFLAKLRGTASGFGKIAFSSQYRSKFNALARNFSSGVSKESQ